MRVAEEAVSSQGAAAAGGKPQPLLLRDPRLLGVKLLLSACSIALGGTFFGRAAQSDRGPMHGRDSFRSDTHACPVDVRLAIR